MNKSTTVSFIDAFIGLYVIIGIGVGMSWPLWVALWVYA